ncbi:AbrB/MazE/SpoVT family DNA-binding domain-containing protein [Candidatus Pacearchaeota archaeon]|nr:AbrB/MazE/SpoVT family DNA-binding domain-containing protein [Candidatus Pacearchaeota archaeon]
MKTLTRTRIVGGSLVVTIPKEIVKEESLQEGELVEIEVSKVKKDFFGVLKGIGHFTKEDKFRGQLEE